MAANGTTLIWFITSGDNNSGVTLPAGTVFITGYAVSRVCAGTYSYDAPFARERPHFPPFLPVRRPPGLVPPAWSLAFRN
jgi:hypothetical protein